MGQDAYHPEGNGNHSHSENQEQVSIMGRSFVDEAGHGKSSHCPYCSASGSDSMQPQVYSAFVAGKAVGIEEDYHGEASQSLGDFSNIIDEPFATPFPEGSVRRSELLSVAPRQVREPGDQSIASAREPFTVTNGFHNRGSRTLPYWERQSAEPPTRPRSTERYFIIEPGSAVAGDENSQQTDLEGGLELKHTSAYRRIVNRFSKARNAVFRAGTLSGLSAARRKRLQYLVILITFTGASTCVSVLSVAGTNNLVITGAITAILALGKILCDVLADHPGDGVGVP